MFIIFNIFIFFQNFYLFFQPLNFSFQNFPIFITLTGDTKYTKTFTVGILICAFGGSFQYGWNISNVNGPAQYIKNTLYPRKGF